ncbi:MAG TPA: TPM domain-containing protein [Burkholderiales bacterium]|nr:TPM domain-containing protein [Burkholderiales bacterium]
MNWNRLLRHIVSPQWLTRRRFPPAVLARIEQAIAQSETRHGGQVRFAVEHALDAHRLFRGVSGRERAIELFAQLRVWDTQHNNGVLIYLLLADRDVEIVADRGIHARAGEESWEQACRAMEAALREGRFEQAIVEGIERVSLILQAHFPTPAEDGNELPDRPVVF